MKPLVLVCALLLAASAPPPAAPPARIVDAALAELRQDDPKVTRASLLRALEPADVDGDGRADFLVHWEIAGGPGWCGSGGCWLSVWLDRGAAAPRKVYYGQVESSRIRHVSGRTILDFELHGDACGTYGAVPCPQSLVWDRKLERLVEHVTPSGNGFIRLIPPLEDVDPPAPAPVKARVTALEHACTARGALPAGLYALSVPDVDGDGARDWLIPPYACTTAEERAVDLPTTLFASAGNAAAPVEAASGMLEIDVSTAPATVYRVNDLGLCHGAMPTPRSCLRVRMRWDAGARKLVEVRR